MINLYPVTIRMIFANSTDQHTVLVALYKLIFPFWHQIKELLGYPAINNKTWNEIAELFIDFDRIHHPDVFAGGCWMSRGFSIVDDLPDWTVSLKSCTVTVEPDLVEEFEDKKAMSKINVWTNDGELIETIQVDDTMIEDIAQEDYIHTTIRDALITAAQTHARRRAAAEELLDAIFQAVNPDQITTIRGGKVS